MQFSIKGGIDRFRKIIPFEERKLYNLSALDTFHSMKLASEGYTFWEKE